MEPDREERHEATAKVALVAKKGTMSNLIQKVRNDFHPGRHAFLLGSTETNSEPTQEPSGMDACRNIDCDCYCSDPWCRRECTSQEVSPK